MRKVMYGAACSLDGFIAGPENAIDWLHFSRDVQAVMADTWARVDTVLMGRKTWEVAVAMGGNGRMKGITGYVFSKTLRSVPAPTRLVADDAAQFVADLKTGAGKDICVLGGGEFARALFAEGLIDEVGLNVHPVLLGSGVPFFRDAGRIQLRLTENRTIDGGCVLARYEVVRAPARRPRRSAKR